MNKNSGHLGKVNGRLWWVIRGVYIYKYHQVYKFKGGGETTSSRNLHRGSLRTQEPEGEPAADVVDQSALCLALAHGFTVNLLPLLFLLTSQSFVRHTLNTLSFQWNLPGLNGYVSGAAPDFVCSCSRWSC